MSGRQAQGALSWDVGMEIDDLMIASSRHLADLRRAHLRGPPPDVKVRQTDAPASFRPVAAGIFSSPARMCAEQSGEG